MIDLGLKLHPKIRNFMEWRIESLAKEKWWNRFFIMVDSFLFSSFADAYVQMKKESDSKRKSK